MEQEPLIESAKRLVVEPGDVVVVTIPGHLTDVMAAQLREQWTQLWVGTCYAEQPPKVVILEEGMSIEVYRVQASP